MSRLFGSLFSAIAPRGDGAGGDEGGSSIAVVSEVQADPSLGAQTESAIETNKANESRGAPIEVQLSVSQHAGPARGSKRNHEDDDNVNSSGNKRQKSLDGSEVATSSSTPVPASEAQEAAVNDLPTLPTDLQGADAATHVGGMVPDGLLRLVNEKLNSSARKVSGTVKQPADTQLEPVRNISNVSKQSNKEVQEVEMDLEERAPISTPTPAEEPGEDSNAEEYRDDMAPVSPSESRKRKSKSRQAKPSYAERKLSAVAKPAELPTKGHAKRSRGRPKKSAAARPAPDSVQDPGAEPAPKPVSSPASEPADSAAELEAVEDDFEDDLRYYQDKDYTADDAMAFVDKPADGKFTTVHIDPVVFNQMVRLMGSLGWTGIQRAWRQKLLKKNQPITTPGHSIMVHIARLQRLLRHIAASATLAELHERLLEYQDMALFYFGKIMHCITFIRTRRLAKTQQDGADSVKSDMKKRRNMCLDIFKLVIPMLVELLVQAWGLGGQHDSDTSFTSSTIHVLIVTVEWIHELYKPAMKECRSNPLTAEPKDGIAKALWEKQLETRAEMGPLLKALLQQLSETPGRLEEEEKREAQMIRDREERLRRQDEIKARMAMDANERRLKARQQNARVASFLRAHRSQTRPSTTTAAAATAAAPSTSFASSRWTEEEEHYIRQSVEGSLGNLGSLDFGKLARELDREPQETRRKVVSIADALLQENADLE